MFPAMTGKPTDISKIISLDLAHQERQTQTFTPRRRRIGIRAGYTHIGS